MRKVILPPSSRRIIEIRVNIFESVISQMLNSGSISFDDNKYLKRAYDLNDIRDGIIKEAQGISAIDWSNISERYSAQRKALSDSEATLDEHQIDQKVRNLADLIYEKCLFGRQYWKPLESKHISKTEYKNDFFLKNGWWICPFCDLTKDPESRSFEIDHFFPKSKFPLVSINERNLIPICKSCNNIHFGKGAKYSQKAFNMFEESIGDHVKYVFNGMSSCRMESNALPAAEFLEMININKRLESNGPKGELGNLLKKAVKAHKSNLSLEQFRDYRDTLFYASKDAFDYAEEIVNWPKDQPAAFL